MARGPKAAAVMLTMEEREALQRLVRRRGAGQAAVMRARIVLMADAEPELPSGAIAARLGVSRQSVITWRGRQRVITWRGRQSVITWRGRFLAHRLDGLVDARRSGAPRRVDDEAVEAMITQTLESQPEGRRTGPRAPWPDRSA